MAAIAVLLSGPAGTALRRSLPRPGGAMVRCRTPEALWRLGERRLLDAVVLSPMGGGLALMRELRLRWPEVPMIAMAPFRPDDGELLLACREAGVAAVLVEGVDDAVAGDLVSRVTLTAARRRALIDAARLLRLTEPLQQQAWEVVLRHVEEPLRTADLARRLKVSREHLSRQAGAGGAPNLKRLIDLARTAAAAQLLGNPHWTVSRVAAMLRFASPGHLGATSRRIAGVAPNQLGGLGPEGVLGNFVRGRMRSR
ncbi:MAG: AraC family transcriptional regulator [Gemmatimonadales bacterium]|nr:AraC family transcriptional regulator [Gemmatimonadales bacterium]